MRLLALALLLPWLVPDGDVVKNPLLSPAVNNPRNSEGDFIALKGGILMFVYSRFTGGTADDAGRSWNHSMTELEGPDTSRTGLQEPGLIELKDGRLMMFMRTDLGCQYRSYSKDGGDTWSPAEPSNILSPLSPASIARIPG